MLRDLVVDATDRALEATIAGSFSKVGYLARRRLRGWLPPPRLDGRVMMITGASSGIGRAAAVELARLGADVWLIGRDPERLRATAAAAAAASRGVRIESAALDLADERQVGSLAERVVDASARLDGLVHNAGVMLPQYSRASDGTELTVATHILAPFRLTCLLYPLLRRSEAPVIVTVSSGGMYTERFDLARLEMGPHHYRGVVAYARAKRAQVVLASEWATRWGAGGVASYAMHPGWVDTPGLRSGLPSIARLGPLLRTAGEGADTLVWLAADGPRQETSHLGREPRLPEGGIWLDRRRRGEYYLPHTRRSRAERRADGEELWDWGAGRTGVVRLPA
jgi:dehydrogenase/reductase SDR family member 12